MGIKKEKAAVKGKSLANASKKSIESNSTLDPVDDYQEGINQTKEDVKVNSPLISWLKQEIQLSWLREKQFKEQVQMFSDRLVPKLKERVKDLSNQKAIIR